MSESLAGAFKSVAWRKILQPKEGLRMTSLSSFEQALFVSNPA
jgi:hypothetical protein